MVIIANARYYAELLRNRPVESDSTGNRTYYETHKTSIVLEPSSPEQSARVDTLVVDSATRPFIPRSTLPLDRSTLSVRVETARRVIRSRSETFYRETIYLLPKPIFSFAQRDPHLFLFFSRVRAFFRDRGAFSTVPARFPPAEERERELDDAHGGVLSTRKASSSHQSKEKASLSFFTVVLVFLTFPKSLTTLGLLTAFARFCAFGRRFRKGPLPLPRRLRRRSAPFLLHHRGASRRERVVDGTITELTKLNCSLLLF